MTDPDFRAAGRPEERAPDGDGRRRRLRAARAAYLEDASLRVVLLAATTLGLAYAFWLFDWGFIAGTGDYWNFPQRDDMDRAQALIGWRYFAQDAWRFPLFAVPSLSYPEGTRIVFTDSIPLFAAVFKLVFQLTGWQFNYFGFWMLLCYVLQATCAALLLYELGVRAWPANLLGTAIGLCSTILLERYPHAALCGHFIVLLSLWCYFAGVRNPRRRGTWPLQVVLLATSVWVSVYLTAMIGVVLAAMVLELVRTRNISARKAGAMLVTSVALMAGVMLAGGLIGPGSPSPAGGGFGNYSMNLLGPFFGDATSLMQRWLGPVPLDATGFQYEGFSYLGAGVLALAAGALTVGFRDSAGAMRSHPMLSLALVSLLLFSLSHRIHAGNVLLAAYPLPEVVTKLAGTFRAGGRMFWPVFYVLTFGLVAWAWRRFPKGLALAIIAAVAVVQFLETRHVRARVSHAARLVNQPALMDANAVRLVDAASRLFVYPSFMCTENDPRWPAPESWRAMTQEAMLVAARRAIPSNSIYVNRTRKDCAAERNALPSTRLEPGTLYIVRLPAAIDWLARIEAPGQCAVKGEAVLCADFVPAAR